MQSRREGDDAQHRGVGRHGAARGRRAQWCAGADRRRSRATPYAITQPLGTDHRLCETMIFRTASPPCSRPNCSPTRAGRPWRTASDPASFFSKPTGLLLPPRQRTKALHARRHLWPRAQTPPAYQERGDFMPFGPNSVLTVAAWDHLRDRWRRPRASPARCWAMASRQGSLLRGRPGGVRPAAHGSGRRLLGSRRHRPRPLPEGLRGEFIAKIWRSMRR